MVCWGLMRAGDDSRWMATWMLLVRTHTRFWDAVEEQMRREHGLTMARYNVLAQLEMAGGRLAAARGEHAAAINAYLAAGVTNNHELVAADAAWAAQG